MFLRGTAARLVIASSLLVPGPLVQAAAGAQQEVGQTAEPQPLTDPEARRLYDDAHRHFVAHDYDRASDELERAYARTGAPALLFDLGQAARLAGQCARATIYYRRFLASDPASGPRDRAEALLGALGPCAPATSAGAGTARIPFPPLSAGSGPASSATAPIVRPAAPQSLLVVAPRVPVPVTGTHTAGNRRRAALLCGIAAAGLFATTGYFAARAANSAEEVSDAFKPGMTWTPGNADAETAGMTSERLAIGSAVAGGLATTAMLWFLFKPVNK